MYNTLDVYKVTKDLILNYVTEYDIFCYYSNIRLIVNVLYLSPFRKETRPSFGIFNTSRNVLMFKDFGLGEAGDCFKFASLILNLKGFDLNKQIYLDLIADKKIIKTNIESIPILDRETVSIAVNTIPFSQEALVFWNSYGISIETLNKFKVTEINKYWINGVLREYKTKNNLIFAYEIYDKYKIYKPFNRQYRFVTNCTNIDIQGWEQLDYSKDTVIITKSTKDIMVLHELGYTSIAVGGEGHNIPDKVIDILRNNFKYIIILFDKDKAGMLNARKLVNKYKDFGFIFTTKKDKDISDHYKNNGKELTIKLISKKIEYAKLKHCSKI